MKGILTLVLAVAWSFSYSQKYIGAGNTTGIKVSSSHNANRTDARSTIDGSGLDGARMEASRFLYQAGFGGSYEDIDLLAQSLDYDNWIERQAAIEPTLMLPKLTEINEKTFNLFINRRDETGNLNDPDDYFGPWRLQFSYTWWDNVAKAPDQLRYKIAHVLSQLMVVSFNSDISNHGEAAADYFDIFLNQAFGNFKDILLQVTLHPTMGYYLSHLNNPKSNPARNQHPDENYAREIMQLFTIGLYELNPDGTRKLNENGNPIPTYTNEDIKELAKVFTGLGGGDLNPKIKREYPSASISFGADLYSINRVMPMRMWESYHERGQKTIVGGYVIPAGQTGMKDIEDAIDHLFHHPNVGPFVARHFIQRMITSNPSPAYIQRVADIFADNGHGIRGDMKAFIKAILLDPEARSCEAVENATSGKLREPILRYTHMIHGLPKDSPTGDYWKDPQSTIDMMKQAPLTSPTVFNFYSPDFQPLGDIAEKELVAPEFQIFDSETAIGYVNKSFQVALWGVLMYDWEEETPNVDVVFTELAYLSQDPEALINRLDILFTHGQMSESTKSVIRETIANLPNNQFRRERAQFALYLTLISPDYVILK